MSRAINSRSLTAPDNFMYAMTYEDRNSYRGYLDEYTTLNQGSLDGKPQSYFAKMPSVKLTIRSMYSGGNALSGEVSGNHFLECNNIVDAVNTLNQISAELTLFDILSSTKTIEPKLREFNEYTKKLFENISDTFSISQATIYDYLTNVNVANPAYEAFIEWCEEFRDLLKSIGLEDYTPDNRNFWRVEGVLSSTQSWEDSKYNLVGFFRNSLITKDYYGQPIMPTKFHPMFKTNPLQAVSNYVSAQQAYYDDSIITVASALQQVAMANALVAKNPQIKTMGITELSSYNHKSYYFTGDIAQMTKQNTDFVSVAKIPGFTTKHLSKLGNAFEDYLFGFKTTTKTDLEVQREQMENLDMNKFKKGINAMTAHWEKIVKHLYKQNAIDEIGLLYSNLLFPQTSNNQDFYKELIEKLNPVQTNYGWKEDLGDDYTVSLYIHQNQLAINFVTPRGRQQIDGDFYSEVKANIISLGVPQYLQQPLRQILMDAREVIDSNSDFELRQVASRIYHIESSRNAGRLRIQEKLQQLHDITFL